MEVVVYVSLPVRVTVDFVVLLCVVLTLVEVEDVPLDSVVDVPVLLVTVKLVLELLVSVAVV
jgi:hypothetical protein